MNFSTSILLAESDSAYKIRKVCENLFSLQGIYSLQIVHNKHKHMNFFRLFSYYDGVFFCLFAYKVFCIEIIAAITAIWRYTIINCTN